MKRSWIKNVYSLASSTGKERYKLEINIRERQREINSFQLLIMQVIKILDHVQEFWPELFFCARKEQWTPEQSALQVGYYNLQVNGVICN